MDKWTNTMRWFHHWRLSVKQAHENEFPEMRRVYARKAVIAQAEYVINHAFDVVKWAKHYEN